MRVTFTENALAEYISWQQEDKKTIKRIIKFHIFHKQIKVY